MQSNPMRLLLQQAKHPPAAATRATFALSRPSWLMARALSTLAHCTTSLPAARPELKNDWPTPTADDSADAPAAPTLAAPVAMAPPAAAAALAPAPAAAPTAPDAAAPAAPAASDKYSLASPAKSPASPK